MLCVQLQCFLFRRHLFRWGNGIEIYRKGNSALNQHFTKCQRTHKLCCQLDTFLLYQIRNDHSRKQNYFNFKAKRIILFLLISFSNLPEQDLTEQWWVNARSTQYAGWGAKVKTSQQFLQLTELPEKTQVLVLTDWAHQTDQMLHLNCPENPCVI